MIASDTRELPYYKDVGRQKGRGFGALAQVFRRSANARLRKYVVLAAKGVGADLFEFAAPELANAVSRKKNFKPAAQM